MLQTSVGKKWLTLTYLDLYYFVLATHNDFSTRIYVAKRWFDTRWAAHDTSHVRHFAVIRYGEASILSPDFKRRCI